MRKTWIHWMLASFLCTALLFGMETKAQTENVYDLADLLTNEEEERLQSYAEDFSESWSMNFLVVTTDDTDGKSTVAYADDFYDEKYPDSTEEDGILYLIDMEHREIYVSTCGNAIRYLTDDRIDRILDAAYEEVAGGDYFGTFEEFFEETEKYLKKGIPSNQYNYDTETGERDYYEAQKAPKKVTLGEFLVALVSGIAAASGTVAAIKAKYQLKFEDFHYDAYTDSEIDLKEKEDRLINTFVTHRRIPRDQGNGGGGSRSSVHTSSSGRSHGGGGRGF